MNARLKNLTLFAWFPLLSLAMTAASPAHLQLEGRWRFELDRQDRGIQERWFNRDLKDHLNLPGALQAQGFGDEITLKTPWMGDIVDRSFFTAPEYEPYRQPGKIKVPFWLQPDKYYAGAAWYQRDLEIPKAWTGKHAILTLERSHWETRVWIDDQALGTNNSLSTPHEYDLGCALAPGQHRLTIRVDNRMVVDVGVNSHSVSDHTQGNWNGIVGGMVLSASDPLWIADLQVFPHVASKSVTVRGRISNSTGKAGRGKIKFVAQLTNMKESAAPAAKETEVNWDDRGGAFEVEYALGDKAKTWDEFQPALYRLTAAIAGHESAKSVTFGLREIGAQGTQFVINGRKLFIRGTLECCIFPKTGHPPTDVVEWKRIIRAAKTHGLNNIRFHSWCPPEAAFIAADELGFYYQVECASWANSSTSLGEGKPIDQWLYDETDRILRYYGNHPSFLLMPYGNEPAGKDKEYLGKWVTHYKAKDGRRLYTSASGWPQIPENQFHVTPDPRMQAWGGGLNSRINALPPETTADYRDYIRQRTVPVISHEIGQWCVYPNFDEIPKYTGYLKPKNFDIFRDSLKARGMEDLAHKFLLASGKLQALCYKEDIESALRTPGMGGFQLLDLHDFPGQGTALVGVLDPFWEYKGYVTAQQYSRFCNSTVPLARLSKRVWTVGETLRAEIEVAHFGPKPIEMGVAAWKLVGDGGHVYASGKLPGRGIPVDNGTALGEVKIDLRNVPAPARCKLVVAIEGTQFENDWDVWVYPATVDVQTPAGITIADELNDLALAQLKTGGKVLLFLPLGRAKGDKLGKVALGFSSIFWNTAWTGRQPPHTLGILCDPKHPALAQFPTDYHSNWQWWYLISQAQAMIMDDLPPQLRPVVQVIDDWVTNRRLGLVFEARVQSGQLLVCSIDLKRASPANPVARQMLHSLLSYMAGSRFKPVQELTVDQVKSLFVPPPAMQKLGAKILKTDSFQPGYEPENAIDGSPSTFWHTPWGDPIRSFPHEIVVELSKPAAISAVTLLPRQDQNHNGWIKDYEIYVANDPASWGEPLTKGVLANNDSLKTITFAHSTTGRYVRLVALSGHAPGPWASLAGLDLIIAKQ